MDKLDSLYISHTISDMTASQKFIAQFSPHLFWDVDRVSIDVEQNAAFLICRVMERGSSSEVRKVWSYYGETAVREALVHAPSLTRKTIAFFANQFSVPKETFRACRSGQSWAR